MDTGFQISLFLLKVFNSLFILSSLCIHLALQKLDVGLEQPIANAAKRTVWPGGGRKQVSLTQRVVPRGP